MKKKYINPSMEVVEIMSQQILAGSVNAVIDDNTQGNGGALGREFFDEE